MLIRVAIAVKSKMQAQELTNRLISFSLKSAQIIQDVEFDLSYYNSIPKLICSFCNIDLAFLSYEILEESENLTEVYCSNPITFSVPFGSPDERICDFLALRPAGHLRSAGDQSQIDKLCKWCAEMMSRSRDVLQIKTRQGCHAVTAANILFCQSDQKYVMLITESGTIYRKLAKLDDIMLDLPDYFERVHQSFLVNTRHISGLDKNTWELKLDSGYRIPVSRVYRKTVSEKIQKFLYDSQK